jgi:monoterpene epsilon-lactone hydrolase
MASLQAHALDLILRYRFKRRVRGEVDLQRARDILAGSTLPVPYDVTFRADDVGGIAGEWAEAPGQCSGTLLYLHGGGYFACSPRTHRPITAAYAQRGFSVFVPEYRLAPEHPYPAAIEDAVAAWQGLLARGHAPQSLSLSGDSAGGGLALALMLTLRDKGRAPPSAAALLSPWTDLSLSGSTIRSNARRDAMFTLQGFINCAGLYLGGTDPKTPYASPLFADLQGLPPMLIHVGEREMLREDSTRVAQKAAATIKIFPVVPHVWQLAQFVPEARTSLDELSAFLQANAKSL